MLDNTGEEKAPTWHLVRNGHPELVVGWLRIENGVLFFRNKAGGIVLAIKEWSSIERGEE